MTRLTSIKQITQCTSSSNTNKKSDAIVWVCVCVCLFHKIPVLFALYCVLAAVAFATTISISIVFIVIAAGDTGQFIRQWDKIYGFTNILFQAQKSAQQTNTHSHLLKQTHPSIYQKQNTDQSINELRKYMYV